MGYGYVSDNIAENESKGFLDKNKILKYVSEEDIYRMVFGFRPEQYQYVTSPLRVDRHPGCWFEKTSYGLVFRDFSYRNRPLDCFDVVQDYFKLPTFYATLKFIKDALIDGKQLDERYSTYIPVTDRRVEIQCESRRFKKGDATYWKSFQISKQNLIDDKVFPVNRCQIFNSKSGDVDFRVRTLAYVYADFNDNRKKIYFPKRNKGQKFLTNCKKDDIGNINDLVPYGKQLIITKSYKDCRVVRNQGKSAIWIQNEGMIPSNRILVPIIKRFEKVSVFYDNDKTGIEASIKLSQLINKHFPSKSSPMWLNTNYIQQGISDPAELIYHQGKRELNQVLDRL